jgi:nicotinamidase-related amidase
MSQPIGPEIGKSALIIVDMQNDFVHPDGGFAHLAREQPAARIDMPFLMSTIPQVKRLAEAFRSAGRPVVYVTQVLRADYSDAAYTPLDTILRNLGVDTCVVAGVTTCVCVSTTIRQGVEYNYRMMIVSDAVAEVHREAHDAELKTMSRIFADVHSTDEVIALLAPAIA